MGFFSDLKEDLSQAVNELMPAAEETPAEVSEETPADETTNGAADDGSAESVSLEEMLKNIDEIQVPPEMSLEEETLATESIPEPVEEPMSEAVSEPEPELVMPVEEAVLPETDVIPEAAAETVAEMPQEPAIPEPAVEAPQEQEEKVAEEPPVAWELREEIVQKKGESKGAEKKMDNLAGKQVADETAIITAGMEINGDINSEGSIDLVGTVSGNIEILGKLNVTGHINGNSKAAEVYAEGAKINGEIISEGAVKIGASSVIIGNITATSAAIAGAVKGDIDVKGPVILDASAIVMGNIKSKSVQINNGAVIEGMCSQCYADVSPTSFFDDYKPETKSTGKKSK